MDTFFVQSLLVTSAIIIQMLKNIFPSVQCNTKFVKKRKNSTFSYCKTQKLMFCVSMDRETTKLNGYFGHFRWHFEKRV